ncbi:MAG: ATP-binding cassette domain-containing protein, partial [Bacteroidota bacterium]
LVRALLSRPRLLIIDNPYIGLDHEGRRQFNQLLDALVRQHPLQLILSGQVRELPKCISHELHLHESAIQYSGPLRKTQSSNNKLTYAEKSQRALTQLKAYYESADWAKRYYPIIGLRDIKIQYGADKILKAVNWEVNQGDKWALIGANGSGKSTLLGIIIGDHPQAYANDVIVLGEKRGLRNNIWNLRRNIGFSSPELHAYFPYDFTGWQIVASGFMDGFFLNRKLTEAEEKAAIAFFDYFEVRSLANRSFRQLSSGEQRLLFFMRAVVKNAPLLLLDEPYQGLDSQMIARANHLLNNILTSQHTLVFISHFEDEIPASVVGEFRL